MVEADATADEFGNAHNIVANEDTDFIYVVGATQKTGFTCNGKGLHMFSVASVCMCDYMLSF